MKSVLAKYKERLVYKIINQFEGSGIISINGGRSGGNILVNTHTSFRCVLPFRFANPTDSYNLYAILLTNNGVGNINIEVVN